jgi:PBP1b-binding outer membrane lipoprotein LpoB
MSKFSKMVGLLVLFTMLLTACGGGQATEAPATQAPTESMTEAPTEVMTEAPTEAPTGAATQAPTTGSRAMKLVCYTSGQVWRRKTSMPF